MKFKTTVLIIALLINFSGYAYVIQGSATVPVFDGNIAAADTSAREKALLNALNNYFSRLKINQPDKEIPDVTEEFYKFIKSYKIAERSYLEDSVNYTVLADVDDVALNYLMYFVKNAVNTAVYNITGVGQDFEMDGNIAGAFKDYKFDTRHQSDFQANLKADSTAQEREDVFMESSAQYFMEMDVVLQPAPEGSCVVTLTTKTFSKTKEFKTLKTKSESDAETEDECVKSAVTLSLLKTLGYVRGNFIPLPEAIKVLNTFTLAAENYDNFATPKKLMEELKTRSFIESYKIKSFAGNKLVIEVQTYVDINILLKKLQSIEPEYGFSAVKDDSSNILLDFTF